MSNAIYDWDAIKSAGDCVRFVREVLGIEVSSDSRCAAVWRGGTRENSVTLEKDQWYDFADGKGGSLLDLCAVSKFGGDMFAAAAFLGEWLNLKPSSRVEQRAEIVATYDYTDADDKLIIQVVRYKPKDFRQRRPNPETPGAWLWSVKDIVPPLYRLKDLRATKWVCIVAGEKDADNLRAIGIPATCNAGGEGKWLPSYNAEFAGKSVVIIADKDDTGRRHAETVAFALRDVAKTLRVLELPDRDSQVKDASDWIEAGGTRDELLSLIKDTPRLDSTTIAAPRETPKEISAAKKANARPFSNYDLIETEDEKGKPKAIKRPRLIMDMNRDLKTRFWGFPCRLGEVCFDHDRNTDEIRLIYDSTGLTTWIAEKSGHQLEWTRNTEGAATAHELYRNVFENAKRYNMISNVPHWPMRSDTYYTFREMPKPDTEAKAFNQMLSFFNPSSDLDKLMLRVFFASPLYYRRKVPRPMWVIDAETAQNSGKSTLVEMLALLYGDDKSSTDSPIAFNPGDLADNSFGNNNSVKRLLSQNARKKRIVLLDNVTGEYKSRALSEMITQGNITGMEAYGRGEETRPNDITYCLTSNSARMDSDLIDRSLFIYLTAPDGNFSKWVGTVTGFIETNRLQILSDISAILERGANFTSPPVTRNKEWEFDVMLPMLGSQEAHEKVYQKLLARRSASNYTSEEAETIEEIIIAKLRALGINADSRTESAWIPSRVMREWCRERWTGSGHNASNAIQIITNMIKAKLLPKLSRKIEKYPFNSPKKTRGFMWNQDAFDDPTIEGEPVVLELKQDGTVGIASLSQSDFGL